MKVYVIGSLRDSRPRDVAAILRSAGHEVFDDWHGSGPAADAEWQAYEEERGHSYAEALKRPLAKHHFALDYEWLQWAEVGVLVMPAGKSGHLELGWMIGQGKRTCVLLDGDPDRWDLMYLFADKVAYTTKEVEEWLTTLS